ncbi:11483_t:CDS:2, partial [Racocetra fulgida]
MQWQKRRNTSKELHDFIDNVIGDYEKWIEYLKNLNEYDVALSTNQNKIIELKNEINKLTVNVEQMELDNENLNNQLENKLLKEQEKSQRLNQEWEKVCFECNDERQLVANLRKKIIDLEKENRELRLK